MLRFNVFLYVRVTEMLRRGVCWHRDERGQATAEYALVLLGAAAIALLVVSWASKTDLVGKLFDTVFDAVTGNAD